MTGLTIFQNILLGISVTATIGPVTIETIRRGLKENFVSAFALNLGAVLVDAFYLLVIFLGLSPWLNNNELRIALGVFGVLILLYLGAQSIREFFAKKNILGKNVRVSYKNSFLAGVAINASNPLALVCWLGFYGFIKATSAYEVDTPGLLFNLSGVIIGGIVCGVALCLMARMGKRFVNERVMRYVSLAAGALLIVFAVYLSSTVYSLLQAKV